MDFAAPVSSGREAGVLCLPAVSLLSVAILAPQLLLALEALQSPEKRGLIAGAPLFAAELAIAVCFWLALLAWPLARLARNLKRRPNFRGATPIIAIDLPRRRAARLNVAEHIEHAGKSTHASRLDPPEMLPARPHGARDAQSSKGSSKEGQDWVTRIEWTERPQHKAAASF